MSPFTSENALDQACTIVLCAAGRPEPQVPRADALTTRVLVAIEGDCFCRVRNTVSGRTSVHSVSPRVFDVLKRARGRVTVFVQEEKIVGFVT